MTRSILLVAIMLVASPGAAYAEPIDVPVYEVLWPTALDRGGPAGAYVAALPYRLDLALDAKAYKLVTARDKAIEKYRADLVVYSDKPARAAASLVAVRKASAKLLAKLAGNPKPIARWARALLLAEAERARLDRPPRRGKPAPLVDDTAAIAELRAAAAASPADAEGILRALGQLQLVEGDLAGALASFDAALAAASPAAGPPLTTMYAKSRALLDAGRLREAAAVWPADLNTHESAGSDLAILRIATAFLAGDSKSAATLIHQQVERDLHSTDHWGSLPIEWPWPDWVAMLLEAGDDYPFELADRKRIPQRMIDIVDAIAAAHDLAAPKTGLDHLRAALHRCYVDALRGHRAPPAVTVVVTGTTAHPQLAVTPSIASTPALAGLDTCVLASMRGLPDEPLAAELRLHPLTVRVASAFR